MNGRAERDSDETHLDPLAEVAGLVSGLNHPRCNLGLDYCRADHASCMDGLGPNGSWKSCSTCLVIASRRI